MLDLSGGCRRLVSWPITFWITLAVAGPPLLAFNVLPSPTFYNQALSFFGWGTVFVALAGALGSCKGLPLKGGLSALLVAMAVLLVAVLCSWAWHGLPSSLALGSIATLIAAAGCAVAGTAAMYRFAMNDTGAHTARQIFVAFMTALVVAGLLNIVIASAQYFFPSTADQWWLVRRMYGFRASGNLRQPNLLASLLVWAIAALVVMVQWQRWPLWLAVTSSISCLYGIALTGSRMGAVLILGLALWGAVDRNITVANRRRLIIAPFVYIAIWLCLLAWSHAGGATFGAEVQLTKADPTSSRLGVWRQTLDLIIASPWQGVGWGEFNFAWTLTPMARNSGYTFTHSHNLLLQWAVELGLPVCLLLVLMFAVAVRFAWQQTRSAQDETAVVRSALLFIVVSMILHSMVEFPLWYAYFLLPTMFAFGAALSPSSSAVWGRQYVHKRAAVPKNVLRLLGWSMALGVALAVQDYQRVVQIFYPPAGSPADEVRFEEGRRSIFYGHLADRFAGTITRPGERSLQPFVRSTHEMLDMRLLIAWALALHEAGDIDRARYIAQRVREFNDPIAKQFFASCETASPRPFQCDRPKKHYTFRDFR